MRLWIVLVGSILLVLAIWVFMGVDPQAGGSFSFRRIFNWVNLVAAVLIVLFGFLFVTVSSRFTGEIGSSSNPISGMTVATLLLTCLIFLLLGWTDAPHRLIALSVAAVVCIASSNGGTTSQDLKTGFPCGATPEISAIEHSRRRGFLRACDRRDPSGAQSGGHDIFKQKPPPAGNAAGYGYISKSMPSRNRRPAIKNCITSGMPWKEIRSACRRENIWSTIRDKSVIWSIRASTAGSVAAMTARK